MNIMVLIAVLALADQQEQVKKEVKFRMTSCSGTVVEFSFPDGVRGLADHELYAKISQDIHVGGTIYHDRMVRVQYDPKMKERVSAADFRASVQDILAKYLNSKGLTLTEMPGGVRCQ